MMGIVIGIAAVIAVVSLGNGMSKFVQDELNGIAGNYGSINIYTNKTSERINRDDISLIESTLKDIKGVSPVISGTGKIVGKRGTFEAYVTGAAPCYLYSSGNEICRGQYFTSQMVDSQQRVCVMLRDDAQKLFGTENVIGMEVDITLYGKTATYTIIGLRDSMNRMYNFLQEGLDYLATIEVPYTSMGADYDYQTDEFSSVEVFADQSILNERVKEAKEIVANIHGLRGSDAISAYSLADFSDTLDDVLGYASKFLILVSVISLIVGGIGVMNIMLVSVTERTREIGIRKSIGAKTGAIMAQFLAEAAILTLLGGIVGIILGIIMANIICIAIGFEVIIKPTTVLGAAMFSILIGLFFGLYPARKAALMKPIDALRL